MHDQPGAAASTARSSVWTPLVLALLWGLNWPAVKIMLGTLPPLLMRGMAFSAAALVLGAVLLVRRAPLLPPRADWAPLMAIGSLTVVAFGLFTAFAQLHNSTSRAAVLTFTMPVMAVVLARVVLGERINARTAWALVLCVAGITLLAAPALGLGAAHGSAPRPLWPLLLPLGAAFSWALGTVVAKRWPTTGNPLCGLTWQMALAAAVTLACAAMTGDPWPTAWPVAVVAAFAFHVLFATALAYLLWFRMLATTGAGASAMTTLGVPVVGVLSAMALVGDRPQPIDWLGFALVLAAAGAIVWRPAAHRRAEQARR